MEMPEQMKGLIIVVLIFLGFPVYFLPAYIAGKREHPERRKILLWNLLLGWTVIGWMVTMILAARGSGIVPTDAQEETLEKEE